MTVGDKGDYSLSFGRGREDVLNKAGTETGTPDKRAAKEEDQPIAVGI